MAVYDYVNHFEATRFYQLNMCKDEFMDNLTLTPNRNLIKHLSVAKKIHTDHVQIEQGVE